MVTGSVTKKRVVAEALGVLSVALLMSMLVTVLVMLLPAPTASAHYASDTYRSYDPDENNNGVIQVWSPISFHGNWHTFKNTSNRQFANHNIPVRYHRTPYEDRAEVKIVYDSTLPPCYGATSVSFGAPDVLHFAEGCHGLQLLFHEGGHPFLMEHHDCIDFWQYRTVMVGNSIAEGGCTVTLKRWGVHDINMLKQKPWNS